MPHGGPHAKQNEFVNRRTGQPIPEGTPYHMHPDKGPMEGAEHNPNIAGGTAGHDFFDQVNGRSQMSNWTTVDGKVYRGRTITVGDITYSTKGGAIEGTSQILHMSETNNSSMTLTPRRATVASNPINRRTNRRRQTTRQANRQMRVGSNNRNPMRNNVMRTTQNGATSMRTTPAMRTRDNSGGHMHNVNDHQHNLDNVNTYHNHSMQVPSQEGEPYNTMYSAHFHQHAEYNDPSINNGRTGRPIYNSYGEFPSGQMNTYNSSIDPFGQTSTTGGQTTGEVGSVAGAGHVHRAGPNVRGQNGNGRMRQTQRRTARTRTNNTMMNNRRTNRRNGY